MKLKVSRDVNIFTTFLNDVYNYIISKVQIHVSLIIKILVWENLGDAEGG